MNKYLVTATMQVEYQVPVEAKNEYEAIKKLDDWIDDDFQPYQTNAVWDIFAQED